MRAICIRSIGRFAHGERLGDRRHDVNRHRSGRRQVDEVLAHFGLQSRRIECAPHTIGHLHRARRPRDVRMLRHLAMHRANRVGGDTVKKPLLDRAPGRRSWDDRQLQTRRVAVVMKDRLPGSHHVAVFCEHPSGVGIAIESREVTARHFKANAVAGSKKVGGGAEIDGHLGGLARLQQDCRHLAAAIPRAQDAVGQRAGGAVREDIHQRAGKVRIARTRCHPERERQRSGHLEVGSQRCARIHQHVGTLLHRSSIRRRA